MEHSPPFRLTLTVFDYDDETVADLSFTGMSPARALACFDNASAQIADTNRALSLRAANAKDAS